MYNLHLIKLFANSKDNLIKCRICIFCIHDKSFSISNLSYFGVKVEGGGFPHPCSFHCENKLH